MARMIMKFAKCDIEVEVGDVKSAVRAFSAFGEVFNETSCGNCDSQSIVYDHHKNQEGHDFYALKCSDCGHELTLGQHLKGDTLFTKRKRPDGTYHKRGWFHWKEKDGAVANDTTPAREPETATASSDPSPW